MLDNRIKIRDGCVARVEFIHERTSQSAHVLKEKLITHSKKAVVSVEKSFKM